MKLGGIAATKFSNRNKGEGSNAYTGDPSGTYKSSDDVREFYLKDQQQKTSDTEKTTDTSELPALWEERQKGKEVESQLLMPNVIENKKEEDALQGSDLSFAFDYVQDDNDDDDDENQDFVLNMHPETGKMQSTRNNEKSPLRSGYDPEMDNSTRSMNSNYSCSDADFQHPARMNRSSHRPRRKGSKKVQGLDGSAHTFNCSTHSIDSFSEVDDHPRRQSSERLRRVGPKRTEEDLDTGTANNNSKPYGAEIALLQVTTHTLESLAATLEHNPSIKIPMEERCALAKAMKRAMAALAKSS